MSCKEKIRKFQIMWKDAVVADVETTAGEDKIKVHTHKEFPGVLSNANSRRRIYDFIKSRCPERDRGDINEILSAMGLREYDPWKIVRITHGVDWDDFYWIRFENEDLTWKDVRVRK